MDSEAAEMVSKLRDVKKGNVEQLTKLYAAEMKETMFINLGKVDWDHIDPKDHIYIFINISKMKE